MKKRTAIRVSIKAQCLIVFLSAVMMMPAAFATHNRAGEITYRCIGPLRFEVTITTYTKLSSIAADRQFLDSVHWGDGTSATFNRHDSVDDPSRDLRTNHYINAHTYLGPGTFDIHFEDPNRNVGIFNIPGSVNVPFFLHTILVIDPFGGYCDNSPILLYPPIDR